MENTQNNYGTEERQSYMKEESKKNQTTSYKKPFDNRMLLGIVVIGIGIVILLEKLFPWIMPEWIFSFPTFLIALGFIIGARRNFTGNFWWILIIVGTYFLIDDAFFSIDFLKPILFPLIIIIIGVLLVARSRRNRFKNWTPPYEPYSPENNFMNDSQSENETELPLLDQPKNESNQSNAEQQNSYQQQYNHSYKNEGVNFDEDFIQLNSFFSGNKRVVVSKKFRGGNVTCMLGGAEVDLVQADFNGVIYLDVFTLMGGLDISVPSDWVVRNEIVCFMGGVDDKRRFLNKENKNKILVLKGTVIMGGVEIKSF